MLAGGACSGEMPADTHADVCLCAVCALTGTTTHQAPHASGKQLIVKRELVRDRGKVAGGRQAAGAGGGADRERCMMS